jgi:hypothetical protein
MRRLWLVMTIATLAFMTGCTPCGPPDLRNADWASRGDNLCRGQVNTTTDFYDLNGDNIDEVFVRYRCVNPPRPAGEQWEVFLGANQKLDAKLVMMGDQETVDWMCFAKGRAVFHWTGTDKTGKETAETDTVDWDNKKKHLRVTPELALDCR